MEEDKTVVAVEKGFIDEMQMNINRLEHDKDKLEQENSRLEGENERLRYELESYKAECADVQEELCDERKHNDFETMGGIEIAGRVIMAREEGSYSQKVINLTMREVAGYLENYADAHDAILYAIDEG